MAHITLQDVDVDFPLYQSGGRSLKKTLLSMASSRIAPDAGHVVVHALRGLTLEVGDNERVALIGSNGAGKTTLLRVMAGIYEPTRGHVHVEGDVSAILDIMLGFDPEATGYENIVLRGLYLGRSVAEMREAAAEIGEFTELGEFLHLPFKTYSSGMSFRLAFAVATAFQPSILLMDEWFAAGDQDFLRKAQTRMNDFVQRARILVITSHNADILRQWCTRAVWIDQGWIREDGPIDAVLRSYARAH